MILAFLAAAAAQAGAVDAERAFADMAQTQGQWTAFRATAAEDAVMFVPRQIRAHDFLKDREDPLLAYMWWPAQAFISCDGKLSVTTGPSVRGAARGYFTTVWAAQPDGSWRWLLDHGDAQSKPRRAGERTRVRRAACSGSAGHPALKDKLDQPLQNSNSLGSSAAPDRTLWVNWSTSRDGARKVVAWLWNGRSHERVLLDEVAAQQ